jgi:glycosyltransferase involved in cell wall biosynthesis
VGAASRVVLHHGALAPERGIEVIVAAIEAPALAAVHAAFLGSGVLESPLRDLASRPASRVHLLPPVPPDELPAWIAGADAGVMPIAPTTLNHRLSTPNKLFECLAVGRPVITADTPAIRSAFDGEVALVPPGDPDALAAALLSLLEDPDLARRLGEAARARVAERFTAAEQERRMLEIYDQIV